MYEIEYISPIEYTPPLERYGSTCHQHAVPTVEEQTGLYDEFGLGVNAQHDRTQYDNAAPASYHTTPIQHYAVSTIPCIVQL